MEASDGARLMGVEGEELPVPRGIGTSVLVATTLATWENSREITIRRYFMRLRILWFFLCSVPMVIVAFAVLAILAGGATAIFGSKALAGLGNLVGIGGLSLIVLILAVEIKTAAALFRWITRDYRARLIARAREIAAARADAVTRAEPPPVPLAELDARLAPPVDNRQARRPGEVL